MQSEMSQQHAKSIQELGEGSPLRINNNFDKKGSASVRNHVIQNLRAHFIHYSIAIKLVMRAQEKIKLYRMSQKPRLKFNQKLGMSL